MTPVDVPKLESLLACATDIWTVRIPEVRKAHGIGEQVELAVINMLTAVADCLDQAVTMLQEDGHYQGTVEHLSNLIRGALSQIADCRAEAEGWRLAVAMVESAKAVKH